MFDANTPAQLFDCAKELRRRERGHTEPVEPTPADLVDAMYIAVSAVPNSKEHDVRYWATLVMLAKAKEIAGEPCS